MKRDKFKCKLCNDTETTLNIHHLQYTAENCWDELEENLVTLCEHCHKEIESLKKEGIDFNKIKIHKSNNWQGGSRVMFSSYSGILSIRIFDKDEKYICGYNFSDDLYDLKKLILNSLK